MGLEEKNKIVNKLISLNIDPVFVLRTRHGIVFNTIVKNVESTLKKTVDDVLNWKLTNMFVICDPVKSKHFLQKLSTMQSLSPRIKTQIYYSKLYVKNQTLSTFGVELTLSMLSQRTLCGINLYKSIDELLKMEKSSNVYVIQYKVLTYEQGQTFELINGPRSTVTNTRLKTAFDFDASYNGFPRQVLPLAIIEFQCSSDNFYNVINRYFENVEHCQFDSSLLITTTDSDEEELIVEKENNEITEHTVQQEEIIESVIRDDISCSVSPYSFKEMSLFAFLLSICLIQSIIHYSQAGQCSIHNGPDYLSFVERNSNNKLRVSDLMNNLEKLFGLSTNEREDDDTTFPLFQTTRLLDIPSSTCLIHIRGIDSLFDHGISLLDKKSEVQNLQKQLTKQISEMGKKATNMPTIKYIVVDCVDCKNNEVINDDFVQKLQKQLNNTIRKLVAKDPEALTLSLTTQYSHIRRKRLAAKAGRMLETKYWNVFAMLDTFELEKIMFACVFGSGSEVIYVTKDDDVYAFGNNNHCCLGLGDDIASFEPRRIEILCQKKVKNIAYGFGPHVLALTEGHNSYGQVGNNSTTHVSTPYCLSTSFFNDKKIQVIACGHYYSACIAVDGEIYMWGHNNCGQLGLGSTQNHITPKKVHFVSDFKRKPVSISCSQTSTFVLFDNGEVFAWGYNGNAQLGIGNSMNQTTPFKISFPATHDIIIIQVKNI
ncbi:unnamed protein product [Didymodactylos carnosus]|uniref:Uncharacterized protein n=1 Tax=Didymodactylos carnosus TaxID=1234261 RepID=A0A815A988_9BILA|nr:unnamed protein product [Didymodactylos carnosus]CAF4025638.1 unnamed protein product [Didymodactylos carnosus]